MDPLPGLMRIYAEDMSQGITSLIQTEQEFSGQNSVNPGKGQNVAELMQKSHICGSKDRQGDSMDELALLSSKEKSPL